MKVKDNPVELQQLLQIAETPIWDGDLISKVAVEFLRSHELIDKAYGFSFITAKGIGILDSIGAIRR